MDTCRAEGCDRDAVLTTEGLCRKHYMRLKRKGSLSDERKNARRECSVAGCGRLTSALGLCQNHYVQSRYEPVRHEGRICAHCYEPVDPGRRANAKFCSRRCKNNASQIGRSRRYMLKRKYGLTEDGFAELLASQGGGCAICGTTEPGGRAQQFHVDHHHETGTVRGILCTNCNSGLGQFKDDPSLLEAAVRYLSAPVVDYTP